MLSYRVLHMQGEAVHVSAPALVDPFAAGSRGRARARARSRVTFVTFGGREA